MKVDCGGVLSIRGVAGAAETARRAEKIGYDGVFTSETSHDPFLPLVSVAEATNHVDIGTCVAIAFARNPMTVASLGWELQSWSRGRLILGLGTQIRQHITKRFSMPWSSPAARMREFVLAMRSIWKTWDEGAPLKYRGEFYRHVLMPPFWNPGPQPYGNPRIFLAAVGPMMTEVVGEVADGFIGHPLTTPKYMQDVTIPILAKGRAKAGGNLEGFDIKLPLMVATGRTEEEIVSAVRATKQQIAFYASTKAYRPVLDLHGWGELQPELIHLSTTGRWEEMAALIDDDMLNELAVVAELPSVAQRFVDRYGDLATRVEIYAPYETDLHIWDPVVDDLKRFTSEKAS